MGSDLMSEEICLYQHKEELTNFFVTKGPLLVSFHNFIAAVIEDDIFQPEFLWESYEAYIDDLKNWTKIEPTRELFESFFVDIGKFILFKEEFESLGFTLPTQAIYSGDLK
jgi:hypothetical protein